MNLKTENANEVRRREILILWECEKCNPNGDAITNEPRHDVYGYAYVTPDRIKRNIRDRLMEIVGRDQVFVTTEPITIKSRLSEKLKQKQNQDKDTSTENKKGKKAVDKEEYLKALKEFIDNRLFGFTYASDVSLSEPGPVQFTFAKSLHPVDIVPDKGNGGFATTDSSGNTKEGRTFRLSYFIPYAILAASGVVNQYRAEKTDMSEEDYRLMRKAWWESFNSVASRSKIGQRPLLWLEIVYDGDYYIGNLHNFLEITVKEPNIYSYFSENKPHSIKDIIIDFTPLFEVLEGKGKIKLYTPYEKLYIAHSRQEAEENNKPFVIPPKYTLISDEEMYTISKNNKNQITENTDEEK